MSVYDKRKEQEVLAFSFQEVTRRVSSGTPPQVAVVEVVKDILQRQAVTLTHGEYTKWCQYLLRVAETHAQKAILPVPAYPLMLGQDTKTGKAVNLSQDERFGGMYVIGKTGSGKTNFLLNLMLQDIKNGMGLCFIDPNGDATNDILRRWPQERSLDDVILLNPLDPAYAFGVNLFEADPRNSEQVSLIINFVLDVFAKLFTETGSFASEASNMERTLRNAAYTLIDNFPIYGTTLAELPLLVDMTNETSRNTLIKNILPTHALSTRFWQSYTSMKLQDKFMLTGSTVSRVERFLSNEFVLHIVGQSHSTLNFSDLMNQGKVILVPLPRTQPQLSSLVGGVLIAQIAQAAFLRASIPENMRRPFCLYVDEFQNMATSTFAELLAEVRKYKIATCVAHQFRSQLDAANRGATLNARNLVVFQIKGDDAEELAAQFERKPKIEKRQEKRLREEYKQTEINTPVEYILQGHTHPSAAVLECLRPLSHLLSAANRTPNTKQNTISQPDMPSDLAQFPYLVRAHDALDELNKVLYEVMLYKMPLKHVPETVVSYLTYMQSVLDGIVNILPYGKRWANPLGPTISADYVTILHAQLFPTDTYTFESSIGFSRRVEYTPSAQLLSAYGQLWQVPESQLASALAAYEQAAMATITSIHADYGYFVPVIPRPQVKAIFERWVYSLRAAMRELAKTPLTESSGVLEQVEEIQEREVDISTAEILARNVNKLVNPKKPYSARVKLGRKEHTILTTPLTSAFDEATTATRRQRIRENTITHYATPREQVEQEIQAREQALTAQVVIVDAAAPAASAPAKKRAPRTKQ